MSYLDNHDAQTVGVVEPAGGPGNRTLARSRVLGGNLAQRRKLANYPGPGFVHMTKEEWRRLPQSCKGSWLEGLGAGVGAHAVRVALAHSTSLSPVYIVDAARIEPSSLSTRALSSSLSLAAQG